MDYTNFDKASQSPWNQRMYDDICSTLLERCSNLANGSLNLAQAKVLDVGCGPAGLSLALLRKISVGSLHLLDLRPDGLEMAARNIRLLVPGLELHLLEGSVHQIPLEDGDMDLVISRGSQRFWEDQPKAMREIQRVLRPGGIAYIGGGRGSARFQELRKEQDTEWFPENYARDAEFRKKLPSYMLPDDAYCDMFSKWGTEYMIYSNEGDGHWFCWRKSISTPVSQNGLKREISNKWAPR